MGLKQKMLMKMTRQSVLYKNEKIDTEKNDDLRKGKFSWRQLAETVNKLELILFKEDSKRDQRKSISCQTSIRYQDSRDSQLHRQQQQLDKNRIELKNYQNCLNTKYENIDGLNNKLTVLEARLA